MTTEISKSYRLSQIKNFIVIKETTEILKNYMFLMLIGI
jgi:hypothetical protein